MIHLRPACPLSVGQHNAVFFLLYTASTQKSSFQLTKVKFQQPSGAPTTFKNCFFLFCFYLAYDVVVVSATSWWPQLRAPPDICNSHSDCLQVSLAIQVLSVIVLEGSLTPEAVIYIQSSKSCRVPHGKTEAFIRLTRNLIFVPFPPINNYSLYDSRTRVVRSIYT